MNFAVKGTSYRSQADINAARNVRVGDELTLIHEAYNDYDSFAMMVLTSDGHHIGYVEKSIPCASLHIRTKYINVSYLK